MPNAANPSAMVLDAMRALTDQLMKVNEHYAQQEARVQTMRQSRPVEQATVRTTSSQTRSATPVAPPSTPPPPPPPPPPPAPPAPEPVPEPEGSSNLRDRYHTQRDQGQSRRAAAMSALTSFGARAGDTSPDASVGGVDAGAGGDTTSGRAPASASSNDPLTTLMGPEHPGEVSTKTALTWGLLGEAGAPSLMRNTVLRYYAMNRSVDWAKQGMDRLQAQATAGTGAGGWAADHGMGGALDVASGAAGWAQDNPRAAFATATAITQAMKGVQKIAGGLSQWEEMGAMLGGTVTDKRYFAGHHIPGSQLFSDATGVGAGAKITEEMMMGRWLPGVGGTRIGFGLSKDQSQQAIQAITGQGWGANETAGTGGAHGDITTLGMKMFAPLMKQMPGLTGEDIGQFLPYLRNSGTSVQQLTNSLSDLGAAAAATHETVGQAAGALHSFVDETQGMGSIQGRLDTGQGFRATTGMDPQIGAQIMQSPIYKGITMSQTGVLPSGQADLGKGLPTSMTMMTIDRLMEATKGLARGHWVADPYTHKQMWVDGKQQQMDQVAQMAGVDPKIVKQFEGDHTGIVARTKLQEDQDEYSRIANTKNLTPAQKTAAQEKWQSFQGDWTGSGIGAKKMKELSAIKDPQTRAQEFQKAITKASGDDPFNALQGDQNKNTTTTVYVQFKGAAAKLFEQAGPSSGKAAANAGDGPSIAHRINTPLGVLGDAENTVTKFVSGLLP